MPTGQAQKEFFVNEALSRIDALLHPAIAGTANVPPATPLAGECWLVGAAPSGAWAGYAGAIACFTAGSWLFTAPRDGMRVLDLPSGQVLFHRGGWQAVSAPASPTGGGVVDTQARAAIAALIAALSDAGVFPNEA